MFKTMLHFFANVLWQCNDTMVKWGFAIPGSSPKPSLGEDELKSQARTIFFLSEDVHCFDLDVRLEGVFVKEDSDVKLQRDVIMLKVFH